MKSNNYLESDIQKYILDELSKKEKLKFEAAMKENPEFAIEVNKYFKIAEGIEHFGAQNFKSRTKDIYSEVRPEIMSNLKQDKSSNKWLKIILVSIALLLVLLFLYRNFNSTELLSSEALYANHYQVYDWNPNLRSDESQNIEIEKALELYSNKSYDQASPYLVSFVVENPNNIPARLALANCHLQQNAPKLAIPHLQHILTLDDVLFQDQANWYLALAYLKNGKKDEAKKILFQLTKDDKSDYQDNSKTILKGLD